MTVQFISHHRPSRKRARAPAITHRRLAALLATVLAIGATAWFAPALRTPSSPLPEAAMPAVPPAPSEAIENAAEATADDQPPAPRQRRRRGVPLDAAYQEATEDYEVLSAAELDAISQARDE